MIESIASELGLEKESIDSAKVRDLGSWIECCRIEAVNWTPWCGGDWEGKVRDPNTGVAVSTPTSETIKGVLRWVLRIALATYMDSNYTVLNQEIAKVYGGKNNVSYVKISVEAEIDRDRDHQIVNEVINAIRTGSVVGIKGYAKLLNTARIRRVKRDVSQLPIPPGCVKLRISTYVSSKVRSVYGVTESDVCKLTIYALLYTLYIHGIGRGTSRGFGRFKAERIECGKLCEELVCRDVQRLARELATSEKAEKAIRELHSRLVEYAKILAKESSSARGRGSEVPSLKLCSAGLSDICSIEKLVMSRGYRDEAVEQSEEVWKVLQRLDAPCVFATVINAKQPVDGSWRDIKDVYDALVAIDRAFLKNTWKRYSEVKALDISFHTWILGLPRYQRQQDRRVEYGYVLITRDERGRERRHAGRRASPIIAYPLPDNPARIAILAYITLDDHRKILNSLFLTNPRGRHMVRNSDIAFPRVCIKAKSDLTDFILKVYAAALRHILNVFGVRCSE